MSSTEMDLLIQHILEDDLPKDWLHIVDRQRVFVGNVMVSDGYLYAKIRDDSNGKRYDIYTCNNEKKTCNALNGGNRMADELDLIIDHQTELVNAMHELKCQIQDHVEFRSQAKKEDDERARREMREREEKQEKAERIMRNLTKMGKMGGN